MAVKEISFPHSLVSEDSEQRRHEFETEVELFKRLEHRHVVGYIAAHIECEARMMYCFQEYVQGGSIANMLEQFGCFSEPLVRRYTHQILLGLQYLHSCKAAHRDLKGANLLVSRDGCVQVSDFGTSKALRQASNAISDGMKPLKGSIYWMAPEVIKSEEGCGRRADIGSVGCTVTEMSQAVIPVQTSTTTALLCSP
jgi:serine/threonine protein kinase